MALTRRADEEASPQSQIKEAEKSGNAYVIPAAKPAEPAQDCQQLPQISSSVRTEITHQRALLAQG